VGAQKNTYQNINVVMHVRANNYSYRKNKNNMNIDMNNNWVPVTDHKGVGLDEDINLRWIYNQN